MASGAPDRSGGIAPPSARGGGWAGAVGGLLGGAVALFILLAGESLAQSPGFLETVADGVTLYVPLGLFETGLDTFGSLAKGLLFAGVAAAVLGAAVLVGALASRGGWLRRAGGSLGGIATAAAVALGVLALCELLVLPAFAAGPFGLDAAIDVGPLQIPLVLAALAYGALLTAYVRGRATPPAPADAAAVRLGRRAFVVRASVVLGFLSLGASALTVLGRLLDAAAHNEVQGAVLRAPTPAPLATPGGTSGLAASPSSTPNGVSPSLAASPTPGLDFGPTPAVTPPDRFYVVAKDVVPLRLATASWRLAVTGLVAHPRTYTLAELQALPTVAGYRTLQCISNDVVRPGPYIGNQHWTGARVRDVLAAASVQSAARFVRWRSADGYTESIPLAVAQDERTWLAYAMGGRPLTPDHGAPLRVLVAGRYGMKQPKYLVEMQLAAADWTGYWERRGWDRAAIVRTYSRIDFPRGGTTVPADRPFTVFGVASAGDRGVARVQVSWNGTTWQAAELEPLGGPIGPLTWRRWRATVRAPRAGAVTLLARAIDGTGQAEDATVRPALPSGATGLPRLALRAVVGAPVPAG
jgi:DMSO/TMAO reductase YedYZ molybdopterin-dependent catalytic subunit